MFGVSSLVGKKEEKNNEETDHINAGFLIKNTLTSSETVFSCHLST